MSGVFNLLGSCQYAKLRKTTFDLLLYSIQPVSEEKGHVYVCVCVVGQCRLYTCGGDFTGAAKAEKQPQTQFSVHQFGKKNFLKGLS